MSRGFPLIAGGRACSVLRCGASIPVLAGKYAHPNGNGTGTYDSPYSLADALTLGAVSAGETLYLRGGTYYWPTREYNEKGFACSLVGASDNRITIQPYPGEIASIDGGLSADTTNAPSHIIFKDLEVFVSENIGDARISSDPNFPVELARPWGGMDLNAGHDLHVVNCIIHANMQGVGLWDTVTEGSEVYGCLIYDNGWQGPARKMGHGIYSQNVGTAADWKYITNNIFHENWYLAVQCYGSSSAYVNYYDIRDNICSRPQTGYISEQGILVGNTRANQGHWEIHDNWCYNSGLSLGYQATPVTDVTFHGNRAIMGNPADNYFTISMYDDNMQWSNYSFTEQWMWYSGAWLYNESLIAEGPTDFHGNPTTGGLFSATEPSGPWAKLTANSYDSSRAHIAIKTFDDEESVDLTVSGFLDIGDNWELRDPTDFHGDAIQSGTCSDTTVSIQMSSDWLAAVLVKV